MTRSSASRYGSLIVFSGRGYHNYGTCSTPHSVHWDFEHAHNYGLVSRFRLRISCSKLPPTHKLILLSVISAGRLHPQQPRRGRIWLSNRRRRSDRVHLHASLVARSSHALSRPPRPGRGAATAVGGTPGAAHARSIEGRAAWQ